MKDNFIASRTLYTESGEVQIHLHAPEMQEDDKCWGAKVEIMFDGKVSSRVAIGEDGFDALIGGLNLARSLCEEHGETCARFQDETNPWHWFPRIHSIIDRTYDLAVSNAIDELHTEHCKRIKEDRSEDDRERYEWSTQPS